MSEGHETLFSDAALELVNRCVSEADYRNCFRPCESERLEIAREVARYAKLSADVKMFISGLLINVRNRMLTESEYAVLIKSNGVFWKNKDPIIATFNRELDRIKRSEERKEDTFEKEQEIVALLRLAKATFEPGEAAYEASCSEMPLGYQPDGTLLMFDCDAHKADQLKIASQGR